MQEEQLKLLIRKYIDGDASPAEMDTLTVYIGNAENADRVSAALQQVLEETGSEDTYDKERFDPLLKNILSADKVQKAPVRKLYPLTRVAAAAVIVLMLSVGGYFYFNKEDDKQVAKTETQLKNDVAPGGNKAILTLANGQQIILDSAANGAITQQGNTKIIKLDDGQLAYNATGSNGEVLYNTISTPKGGQYQIILSDGSKVWLNAASSLRFPASFAGKVRDVELTGEGYFEVAHQKVPFIVSVNNMKVEVLGTHFNINAYNDEDVIKTTLLEGSVKIQSTILKPGQQAQLNKGQIKVVPANVDEAIAWKNGRFIFQGNNIQSVMRQLARWYNVDVSYQGNITDEEFVGVISKSRYENISEILNMLEKTRTVSFEIKERNITVTPFRNTK